MEASSSRAPLDLSLVRGVAWTGGVKWLSVLVSWASTLVVARILTPQDYGLVGLATLYLALVTLLSEFGIGTAIVTLRDLTNDQIAQINTLAVVLGAVGVIVSCIAAIPLGWFFDSPQLPLVVVAMSMTFAIMGFRVVPYSLLQKELRFKRLALLEGAQAVILAAASVAFAILGFRYWTLVLAALLSALISSVLFVWSRPFRFAWPHARTLGPALTFGRHVITTRVCWYVYANADMFVAGKWLGSAALGAYTFAWTLASTPVEKVTGMVMRVTPSIFSAVQHDRAALRRYVLKLTEGLALVTFPATFGLALVAEKFVLLALGSKWLSLIAPLQILAFYASVRAITPLLGQVLNVTGDARYSMRVNILGAILLPGAFYAGSRWGIAGIATVWVLAHPFILVPFYQRVFRRLDMTALDYFRSLWPALSASGLMGIMVIAAGQWSASWPLAGVLAAQILSGGAVYVATLALFHRERVRAFFEIVSRARS